MKNIVKVILGVAVVGIIVGGCFMFFNKNGTSNISGRQKVILTNKDKSVTLDFPKANQLDDSEVAVMGMIDLTEEQEKELQSQREEEMEKIENGETVDESTSNTIEDNISGKNYDVIKDKKIKEISLNLKNGVSVRYQLADVVYDKDTLQSISNSDDKNAVKEVKIGKDNFMYTGTKQEIKNQDPYYYYYIISNKLKSNSIFIVITSQGKELDENALTDYMSAVKF